MYPSVWSVKPFQGCKEVTSTSHVAISFSPKHYLVCSRFCLVWTLLLCIWKTDGFEWLYVCVSLNLVTCVFDLINACKFESENL